jgi:hypothetical protein
MASHKAEKSDLVTKLPRALFSPPSSNSRDSTSESDEAATRILYDVWVHRHGSHLEQASADENASTLRSSSSSSSVALWSTVTGFVGSSYGELDSSEMVDAIKNLESNRPQSQLALANDAELVALIHQSILMVFSSHDEYASVSWRHPIGSSETLPQRHHLSWNVESTLLAVASSDRKLMIFSRSGRLLNTQEMKTYQGRDVGGVVEIGWSRDTAIGGRASQLYILTYSGILFRYLVYHHHESSEMLMLPLAQALELKDDPKTGPLSNLKNILEHHSMLTCMDISPDGKYLAIGGYGRAQKTAVGADEGPNEAQTAFQSPSVSFWRILSVPPFFEYMAPVNWLNSQPHLHQPNKTSKRCCGRRTKSNQKPNAKAATKSVHLLRSVQFSPDSHHLLALDTAGIMTIWDIHKQLPIRRYRSENVWKISRGPESPSASSSESLILNAQWWNANAVFVMHAGGACAVLGPIINRDTASTPRLQALNLSPTASSSTASASLSPLLASSSGSSLTHSASSGNLLATSSILASTLSSASNARRTQEDVALHNLLGPSSEVFAPNSTTSRVRGQRIFIFESVSTAVQVPRKRLLYSGVASKPRQDIDPDLAVPYDYEMEGAEQPSWFKKAALSTWRWFVGHTDDKLGDRTITKRRVTNRLLSMRKTTPTELLLSKVTSGDYDFAESLASLYHLNPDIVYQTQWRLKPVSEQTISEYLDKISDREWVLRECIERVPLTLEAATILLNYGIRHAVPSWMERGSGDKVLTDQEAEITKQKLEALVMAGSAALECKDIKIVIQRMILLSHLDRLHTYTKINERNVHFDAREYLNFRSCSLVNACATFAQNEDIHALEVLWTLHSEETLPYRLILLRYLPETLAADSDSVRFVYPSVQQTHDEAHPATPIEPWEAKESRAEDWSETIEMRRLLGMNPPNLVPRSGQKLESVLTQYEKILREEHLLDSMDRRKRQMTMALIDSTPCVDVFSLPAERPEPLSLGKPDMVEFSQPIYRELTAKDLSKWYKLRAMEIERLSGQADKALALVQLGIRNRVPRLEKIHEKLRLLCSLVYECGKDTHLAEFEHMDNLRRLHFLLEDSSPSTIVPILSERCEVYIHNAHQVWRQYELEGAPHFTTAFLAQWMSDIARTTSNHLSNATAYGMLPHLVQIFKASAKQLREQSRSHQISAAPSSSSLTTDVAQSVIEVSSDEAPIIPTEKMLALLGLHVCYLISPSSSDVLNHLTAIHKVLPQRVNLPKSVVQIPKSLTSSSLDDVSSAVENSPAKPAEKDSPSPNHNGLLHTVASELSSSSLDIDLEMEVLYDKVELLGKHIQAAEILFRYDLIKPLDMFFTTWRADDPVAIRQLLERLVQRDVRANPPLTNARWRETLKALQQLRDILSASRPLFASIASSAGLQSHPSSLASSLALTKGTPDRSLSPAANDSSSRTPTKKISPAASALLASPSHVASGAIGHGTSSPGPSIPVDLPFEVFCQALLRSGNFSLAKHYLYDLPNYEELVISTAQFYFNSCSSAKDKDMQLAQDCLALIRSPSAQTKEEQKLIDAVVQMSKLEAKFNLHGAHVLPIQVRNSSDRMSYLRQLLEPPSASSKPHFDFSGGPAQSKEEIYQNLEELLDLGRLLGCASSDSQRQEIKLLAANRAFNSQDYERASKWCLELMSSPTAASNGVWDLAYRLAMVEKVDIHLRTRLLAFSMRYAPNEALQPMISVWRALEVRSSCASIGINVEMPRGTPSHLHLKERHATKGSSAHDSSTTGAPLSSSSSLRFDARKVRHTQTTFINTCLSKIEEMSASKWMTKMESEMVDSLAEDLHLYGFYHPVPHGSPYVTSDTQLRVDPLTGPLATFGEKAIEREILTRIKTLDLAITTVAGSARLETVLNQMAQVSATNGDLTMLITCLLDPTVSVQSATDFFDSFLARATLAVSHSASLIAKYYFGALILQLFISVPRTTEELEAVELAAVDSAALFELSPLLLVKRAEKVVSKAQAGALFESDAQNTAMEALLTHWTHFSGLNASHVAPVAQQSRDFASGSKNGSSKSYVLNLARNTTPEGLERALQALESGTENLDEFALLEAHFVALIETTQVNMSSINEFLRMYGGPLTHQHTLRFERTLESLWQTASHSISPQRLRLILKLQISCAKMHASAKESAPASINHDPVTEKYENPDFVAITTKRAELLESLAKSLLSAVPAASEANGTPDKNLLMDWKALLSGNPTLVISTIQVVVTMDNVAIIARAAPQLSEICKMAFDRKDSEEEITASQVYFMLAESVLTPLLQASSPSKDVEAHMRVVDWFKRHLYSKLNATHLHLFIEQFLVAPSCMASQLRLSLCEDILEYLNLLLGGEEDETVILLKSLKTHLFSLTTIQSEWAGFRASASPAQKQHLTSFMQLLDETFRAPHKDAEIAVISSRLLANGWPLSMVINIVEVYHFENALGAEYNILDIVNHIVLDAVKNILELLLPLSEAPSTNQENPILVGDLVWPPTQPEHALAMLRAVLRSVTQSGSPRFYRGAIERIREAARKMETSEPIRILLLNALVEHPSLYETRKDWLLQDEKLIENHLIAKIVEEFDSGKDSNKTSSAIHNPSAQSDKDKLDVVYDLIKRNSIDPAYRLLWVWSSKTRVSATSPASMRSNGADADSSTTSVGTTQKFQLSASSQLDGDDTSNGWDDDFPAAPSSVDDQSDSTIEASKSSKLDSLSKEDTKLESTGDEEPETDDSTASIFPFALGWSALFYRLLDDHNYEKLLSLRSKVPVEWMTKDMDSEIVRRLEKGASSSLISWKYSLVSSKDDIVEECIESIREHIHHRPLEPEPVAKASGSGLRGFFRGIVASIQPINAPPLRYGADYDAQLLYLLLKYGAFVELMAEDAMRPLIKEAAFFLLGAQSLDPSHPGYSEYQQLKEAHQADLQAYDASITYPAIVSALVKSGDMDQVENFIFEQRQVSRSLRTRDHFKSIVKETMKSFVDGATNKVAETEQNKTSSSHERLGLSWHQCLIYCKEASKVVNSLA